MSEVTAKSVKATTTDLENYVYEALKCKKNEAHDIVAAVIDGATKLLIDNGALQLSGLGVFSVSTRAPRQGVNPKTGEKIQIAETVSVTFKNSSTLRTAVRTKAMPVKAPRVKAAKEEAPAAE